MNIHDYIQCYTGNDKSKWFAVLPEDALTEIHDMISYDIMYRDRGGGVGNALVLLGVNKADASILRMKYPNVEVKSWDGIVEVIKNGFNKAFDRELLERSWFGGDVHADPLRGYLRCCDLNNHIISKSVLKSMT